MHVHQYVFNATTGFGITNWDWTFGDGNIGAGNPVNYGYPDSGDYTVHLMTL